MRSIDFYEAGTLMLLGFHIAGVGDVSWGTVLIPLVVKYGLAMPFGALLRVSREAALATQKEKELRDKVMR